jgi:hypothetical protein
MKPQSRTILNALLRGETLTMQTALRRHSIAALSQRITELRRDPSVLAEITSRRVENEVYHEYFIEGLRRTNLPAPEGRRVQVVAHTRRIGCAVDDQPSLFGGAS